MKLSHLKQITSYLKNFKKISAIYRVSDTIIKIAFDKDEEVYFNLQKSNSSVFKCKSYPRSKVYNAPFDVILAKRFNRANILHVECVNGDKVIRFKTVLSSAYKEQTTYLQLEFTGKYTNAIILDEDFTVLEALRHIDLFSSFREVRVGQKLLEIPKPPFKAKEYPLEDVEQYLFEVYNKEMEQKLSNLKKQKLKILEKKLQKLQKLYEKLDDEQTLLDEAKQLNYQANLILANMYKIKPYSKTLHVEDYDGSKVCIELNLAYPNVSQMSEYLFTKSKKAKQRAKNLHIEKESLSSKINHLKLFINTVKEAKDISKIELLFPKQIQNKKVLKDESIDTFFIEGYKVSIGKNEKGNIKLLQNAKAKDIWIHLKDRPSAHVIISTDKQTLPQNIIQSASRLCVDFSVFEKGRYLVDYTQRREVSVQSGANVFYNKYKTIEVDTRG